MTFGRTEVSDIVIADDPVLSSRHFKVSVGVDRCTIEDLNSTNGTWLDGQQIASRDIDDGTRIKAGNLTFVFKVDARDPYKRTTEDAHELVLHRTGLRDPSRPDFPTKPVEVSRPPADSADPPIAKSKSTETTPSPPRRSVLSHPERHSVVEPPRSPSRTKPISSTPKELTIELSRSGSGLWRGVQATPTTEPLFMIELLSGSMNPIWMIDFARTGLPPYESSDEMTAGYLIGNLPPEAAAIVSPRMVQTTDFVQRTAWTEQGWGSDGIILILSHVDVPPMLEHFQRMMKASPTDKSSSHGMLGLCWPSVLEGILRDGKAKLVNELIEPCEVILVDSPDSPGGWAIYGDDRLPDLLASRQIPQTTRSDESDET